MKLFKIRRCLFFTLENLQCSRESSEINKILESIFLFYNRGSFAVLLANLSPLMTSQLLFISNRLFKINKAALNSKGRKSILWDTKITVTPLSLPRQD